MQQQIASYLFHQNYCPLPGIGTLMLRWQGAVGDFTDKLINAPKPAIVLDGTETDPSLFVQYLSSVQNRDQNDTKAMLESFCSSLKNDLAAQKQVDLPGIGLFYSDSSGSIRFTEQALPVSFTQPVHAERVIHPNDEHHILVGDKETTNTVMTEMLAPKEAKRESWWVWAIVLGLVAITAIMLYFAISNNTASLGNSIKI